MARHAHRDDCLRLVAVTVQFLAAGRRAATKYPVSTSTRRARRVQEQLAIKVEPSFLENNTLPEKSFNVYIIVIIWPISDPGKSWGQMTALLRQEAFSF